MCLIQTTQHSRRFLLNGVLLFRKGDYVVFFTFPSSLAGCAAITLAWAVLSFQKACPQQ